MKKILFTLALMAFATAASAQFLVSVQLGGFYSNGSSNALAYQPDTTSSTPLCDTTDITMPNNLNTYGGIKFGYQFGRLQIGLAAGISWSHVKGDMTTQEYKLREPNCPYINTNNTNNTNWPIEQTLGWYKENAICWNISPYARYELIQLGDVAFFAELNGYFAKAGKPKHEDFLDWYAGEMHQTIDTIFNVGRTSTSLGARITPGLSWQLTPHCYVDLYLDVLAFAFDKTTLVEEVIIDEYDYTAYPRVLSRRTTRTTTTNTTEMGFGITGSPWLSNRNWVRVGFNYTF